jgi:hypothetical protein
VQLEGLGKLKKKSSFTSLGLEIFGLVEKRVAFTFRVNE